jgi:hypothetical protein
MKITIEHDSGRKYVFEHVAEIDSFEGCYKGDMRISAKVIDEDVEDWRYHPMSPMEKR